MLIVFTSVIVTDVRIGVVVTAVVVVVVVVDVAWTIGRVVGFSQLEGSTVAAAVAATDDAGVHRVARSRRLHGVDVPRPTDAVNFRLRFCGCSADSFLHVPDRIVYTFRIRHPR